ncbi:hypothetical protein N656DRAFT_799749 [Canariomyces notabilis]|uniref:Uncharacterized protein n=1 Tax=Canariomyces notabilis TaxID=2074819 RepID=A0AAN6QLU6_9PEZI|nr:hypothetical protein N656DRAFT_799749 [Canariomyces arenarius]
MRALESLYHAYLPVQNFHRLAHGASRIPLRRATTTRPHPPPPPSSPAVLGRPPRQTRSYSQEAREYNRGSHGDNNNNNFPPQNPTLSRAERLLSRLPRPLQRYTTRLRGAPVTHVAAFLALHEITAVVPLLGLFALFHYYNNNNSSNDTNEGGGLVGYLLEHYGGYVSEGVGRFERWFRRRGWFGFGQGQDDHEHGEGGGSGGGGGEGEGEGGMSLLGLWQGKQGDKYRVVVEVALAYAVTKVLLPVRIMASLWATPWFAGVLMRVGKVLGRGGKRG